MSWERELHDVVETLQSVSERGRGCTLLIGAGCSASAKIPVASEIVAEIRDKYRRSYLRATRQNYAGVMAALSPAERHELIARHVDDAKINWAHVAIAELMKHRFVDRVLTTNFDPLVVRAAAMTGEFPAVYDFAASQDFNPADLPAQAVFHLHGQRSGFAVMNTQEEFDRLSRSMAPLFLDAGRGRCWIVVGYSGENDPVFDHLAAVERFDDRLYWVGYRDEPPGRHVRERLTEDKYAYYVKGYDADSFFIGLAQKLDAFPPRYIGEPFSALDEVLRDLGPYPIQLLGQGSTEVKAPTTDGPTGRDADAKRPSPGASQLSTEETQRDITAATRAAITQAKQRHEHPDSSLTAWASFLRGDHAAVVKTAERKGTAGDLAEPAYWSYISMARDLIERFNEAAERSPDRPDQYPPDDLERADELFRAADEIERDDSYPFAYIDWGNLLSRLIRDDEAMEKFRIAHDAEPHSPDPLVAWATALGWQADSTDDDTTRTSLHTEQIERFRLAHKLAPDDPLILNTWGNAYIDQSRHPANERTRGRLLRRAIDTYDKALERASDPDTTSTILRNASFALQDLAGRADGRRAEELWAEAEQRAMMRVEIDPDDVDALDTLGSVVAFRAEAVGVARSVSYMRAIDCWQRVLELEPDNPRVPIAIALAIMRNTRLGDGIDVDVELDRAEELIAGVEVRGGESRSTSRNRVRLAAYRGDEELTAHLLDAFVADYMISRDDFDRLLEHDLEVFSDSPWYHEIVESLSE